MRSPLKQTPKKSTVSAHGQLDDAEREYQDDLAAHNKKKGKYWYKINGKPCTKAEYNAYKNKPGSDEPGKTTNDPDASGNKAKIAKDRANNEASKKSTVLTEAQTKLNEKKPPLNYQKTPLDFSSPLKGKKRRARRALREEKYGTKSRRKARKIEGTTRSQQKRLERLGTKASAKRTARNTKRYKGFTDAELMARKEQGSSYKKTPLDFKSPVKQVRKDSTITYNQDTLNVDSTPVGHRLGVKSAGFGWGAAIKAGNEKASMVKALQDRHATNKLNQSNKEKESKSTFGSGGKRPIMSNI